MYSASLKYTALLVPWLYACSGRRAAATARHRLRARPGPRRLTHAGSPGPSQNPAPDRRAGGVRSSGAPAPRPPAASLPRSAGGDLRQQRREPGDRLRAAMCVARDVALADAQHRAPALDPRRRVPRGQPPQVIGRVEDHGTNHRRMPRDERLREPATVRIAVDRHPAGVEPAQDRGEVGDRVGVPYRSDACSQWPSRSLNPWLSESPQAPTSLAKAGRRFGRCRTAGACRSGSPSRRCRGCRRAPDCGSSAAGRRCPRTRHSCRSTDSRDRPRPRRSCRPRGRPAPEPTGSGSRSSVRRAVPDPAGAGPSYTSRGRGPSRGVARNDAASASPPSTCAARRCRRQTPVAP